MWIFVSFLLLVEGKHLLYESAFQSLETICSYPWYIFLLACSTFLMGWGTLFRYAAGETKDSQVLQDIKNHLEILLFIWHFTDKCHTWPRTKHTNSCLYLYSCTSHYPHPHYSTWCRNQVHYPLITSSKKPGRSIVFHYHRENHLDRECSRSFHGEEKDRGHLRRDQGRGTSHFTNITDHLYLSSPTRWCKICEIRKSACLIFNAQDQHKAHMHKTSTVISVDWNWGYCLTHHKVTEIWYDTESIGQFAAMLPY